MRTGVDAEAFLERIGVAEVGPPSVEALFRLHAAYVEAVPYESVQFQLGQRTPLDPVECAERIIQRRAGGYCFQLNGAFAALLDALGFQVTRHHAGVETAGNGPGISLNHLALTVTGLPDAPGETWLVDAGLGDAMHVPLPLCAGEYRQGPFTLRVRPSEIATGGWRLDHDPRGSFVGMDFSPEPAAIHDFAERHEALSTSPMSMFLRVCTAMRRTADAVYAVRSLTLSTVRAEGTDKTLIESREDWYAALRDMFGLPGPDRGPDRERLWRRVVGQHEAYVAQLSS